MSSKLLLVLALTVTVLGCGTNEKAVDRTTKIDEQNLPQGAPPSGGGANANPGIVGSGVGGAAPVTNPAAVEGSGSGVGQAAKDEARKAADRASQGSSPSQAGE